MIKIMPSIDISNGRAVKRIKGVKGTGLVLGNPTQVAEKLFSEGYEYIHIVDLDAAEGSGDNSHIIRDITSIGFRWIQVGGGVRDLSKAQKLVDYGVTAVVISTLFFKNRREFNNIVNFLGNDKVIVALDYRSDGYTYVSGWKEKAKKLEEVLEEILLYPRLGILFTYVDAEGTMSGIDKEISKYTSKIKGVKEYAGGISSYNDILFLDSIGFDYAIIGMALYKISLGGRFD
ncbi:MAG: 1-(5-phosphoribosyl)-5-((5-phosphoribosylamino)methylideneamino)imidazole-4-carboxamide isomerase [Ignisphaera sp.]